MSKRFISAARFVVLSLLVVVTATLSGCFCYDYDGYEHDCGGAYHHGGHGYHHGHGDGGDCH